MFPQDLIVQLAAELNQSEKSRVQLEHFSRRFPGMTFTRPTNGVAGDTFHADYGPLGSIAFRFV